MTGVIERIKDYVNRGKAFAVLLVGPRLNRDISISKNVRAFPIRPLGNHLHTNFGFTFLRELEIPVDINFINEAVRQGAPFNEVTLLVFKNLNVPEFKLAGSGDSQKVIRAVALLSFYSGGPYRPIMRMKWLSPGLAEVEFLAPAAKNGLADRLSGDPISDKFLSRCFEEHSQDDQLHFFLSMMLEAISFEDEFFRIARYYSLLESMCGAVTSQFLSQSEGRAVTRTAIRFVCDYFIEFDITRFTLLPDDYYEFDHIELAGRLRHKLFHGGGRLLESDVPQNLKCGVKLLYLRPELISHQLRRDCERVIAGWVGKYSKAYRAQMGEHFDLPLRNPDYTGKELAKQLISSPAAAKSHISSIFLKVEGIDISAVRFQINQ